MGSVLHAVGAFSARRRWLVIAIWALVLASVAGTAALVQQPTEDAFTIPGTASVDTYERLGEAFPTSGGTSGDIVIEAPDGASVTDPAYAAQLHRYMALARELPGRQNIAVRAWLVYLDARQCQPVEPAS